MLEFIQITDKDIKNALIHLKQIVFEVTDACNLRCKYCAYADLYEGYDKRENLFLSFDKAKVLLDYLYECWSQNSSPGISEPLTVGFYGGEPLLHVPFIKEVINYIEQRPFPGKKVYYNMTTNAMLLDKYMDFLVEKEFQLLISLDGDREGQSYRVDANGINSFDRVIGNIELFRSKYPDYFNRFVNFNTVLHNRNSVERSYRYINDRFGKRTTISSLSNSGIRKDKLAEFNRIYRNYSESVKQATNCESLAEDLFIKNPETSFLLDYVHYQSGNVYRTYSELFFNKENFSISPTGTCIPFTKKMFVTVKGRILQCEKINHEFAVGRIGEKGVELDLQQIAQQYNEYVFKYMKQCRDCAQNAKCVQCVFQIDDIQDNDTYCRSFSSPEEEERKAELGLDYLGRHPKLYRQLLKNTVIRG